MVVRELSALSFRNFKELRVSFSDGINVLVGKNGQGKTNVVEAIYFLNHLDSFRTHQLGELVAQGQPLGQIQGILNTQESDKKVRVEISRRGRKVQVNEAAVPKLSAYVADYFALVFNPDHLYLFRHVPAERRWLLNRYLSFADSAYLNALREFRVVHAQKNQLLKRGELSSLPAWNQLFAERSHAILGDRSAFATRVNPLLSEAFSLLTGRTDVLQLEMHASLTGTVPEMVEILARARESEGRMGHALHGPHRDDVRLKLGEPGAGSTRRDALFSQGEYRAALLALQLALGRLLEAERGFRPVLILDDVFSELDASVRERLLQYLPRLANQMFITTTEWTEPMHVPGARIMEIQAGRVAALKD
ncbi:MAG TPA: DNA replication and repair protein RecF [bacterium]